MAPVRTPFHSLLRRWLALCVIGVNFAAGAQTRPAWIVPTADQARRDAARTQILQAELAGETAALAKAQQRQAERAQAGDHAGAVEAWQALRQHATNIEALRRELHPVVVPRGVSQAVNARPAPLAAAGAQAAPSGADTRRTWGMYPVHPAQQPSPVALTVAPEHSLPAWDLYARSRGSAVSKSVERSEVVLTEVTPLAPPAVPYLVYRDPNAQRESRVNDAHHAGRH